MENMNDKDNDILFNLLSSLDKENKNQSMNKAADELGLLRSSLEKAGFTRAEVMQIITTLLVTMAQNQ